jgi:hypothetical protein
MDKHAELMGVGHIGRRTIGGIFLPGRGLIGPNHLLEVTDNITEDPDSNITGLIDALYIIPYEHITAFGTFAAGGYDNDTLIDVPHTLDTGNGRNWILVDMAENKGKFSYEGPKGRQGNFNVKLEGMIPGMASKTLGAINSLARRKVIALGVDRAKNTIHHIGWENMAASINFKGDTGEPTGAEVGNSFEVVAAHPWLLRWDPGMAITTY